MIQFERKSKLRFTSDVNLEAGLRESPVARGCEDNVNIVSSLGIYIFIISITDVVAFS